MNRPHAQIVQDADASPAPPPPPPGGGWRLLWWRFNRFLERHLPQDLYRRTLLIVVLPISVLLLVITGILLDRHWEEVTKRLSKEFGREVGLVVHIYDNGPKTPEALQDLITTAHDILKFKLTVEPGPLPPVRPRPWFSILHYRLSKYVSRFVPNRPFWLNTEASGFVEVRILVDENRVFRFRVSKDRVYATSTPYLLLWTLMTALIILAIALAFLRKQILPILDLAKAMQAFGRGHAVPPLRPRGAREVRAATDAFLAMKRRIERHVEQRTAMLAGVSHDLRTILTRFRLELSLLDADPERAAALKRDVDEMQHMLQGYMDFVRGAGSEPVQPLNLCAMMAELEQAVSRPGKRLLMECPATVPTLKGRPGALRRALMNVLENAMRHAATRVRLRLREEDGNVIITIDDDGPGIPAEERERVFRPFVRLDDARNLDAAGTGLGLAIARDLILGHGGHIELADSPLGGLRVRITLPA